MIAAMGSRPPGILPSNIDQPLGGAAARQPTWRVVQNPWLVGALVFATFDLYAFWWLGRTWWQIKQEDGDSGKHPVWHALAMLVPIYGYLRFYAHMRSIVAIAATPEARAALSPGPGAMTVAWIIVNLLASTTSLVPAPIWVSILASGLGAALIGYAQSGLNAAWLSLPGGARRGASHPLHWALLLLGFGIYLGAAIVGSVSPENL
jgi:hypothetical protein